MDDVVDQPWWSRVGGEFWNGKCALPNPLNQVITETQSIAVNYAQTTSLSSVARPPTHSPTSVALGPRSLLRHFIMSLAAGALLPADSS